MKPGVEIKGGCSFVSSSQLSRVNRCFDFDSRGGTFKKNLDLFEGKNSIYTLCVVSFCCYLRCYLCLHFIDAPN